MDSSAANDHPETLRGPYFFPGLPTVHLEIVRGRAKQRRRAVEVPAFLIGRAGDCDLVLADAQIPEVHAYLFVTQHMVTIRHLSGPELTVNGQPVSTALLADGDRIRTGPYEFQIAIQPTTVRYHNHSSHEQAAAKRHNSDAARSAIGLARDLNQNVRRTHPPLAHDNPRSNYQTE